MKNIVLVLCFILFFSSCEKDIVYEFASTSIKSSDFELCAYDQCPEVSLEYVEFNAPKPLAKQVNRDIENVLIKQLTFEGQQASSVKEAVELYLSNSQNSYPEDSVFSEVHELQIMMDIVYTSNDIMTLQSDYYEFAGGAHGIGGVSYWNYDPRTGQKFENTALFKDLEDFTAFAKAKFIKTHGPLDQFWFESETFALPANIGFNQQGMTLFYNVYEIAPYAEGTFQLDLVWNEVEKYLSF